MYLNKVFNGEGAEYNLDSDKIGELTELSTEHKNNLIEAINEIDGRVPKATIENEGYFVRVVEGKLTVVPVSVENWLFALKNGTTAEKKVVVLI